MPNLLLKWIDEESYHELRTEALAARMTVREYIFKRLGLREGPRDSGLAKQRERNKVGTGKTGPKRVSA